ncbi:tRNA pseudouridine synthase [Skeletonema marinoi]|uniref:tRNA pseudouridine synthase n=1 Tax=Skeletonema marinoi TaxID=267567 RepID=A0AAD8Y8N8_9STRA|nr:tRNA pseudouridine synthase [Skeletonema marinoi]
MEWFCTFEARQNVARKTYIYRLRFRCIAYESNAKSTEGQTYLHPICNAGPHLLRRLNDNNTVWLSQWPLDKEKLRQACEPFVGRHNFCNFVHKAERKVGNSRPSLVRRRERYEQSTSKDADDENDDDKFLMDLFEFNLHMQPEEEPDKTLPPIIDATFSLKAKGFHRSQVRNLVGFVVDVARGERSLDDAKALLGESDTADDEKSLPTVNSAPASGLCLANVEYEHDDFL